MRGKVCRNLGRLQGPPGGLLISPGSKEQTPLSKKETVKQGGRPPAGLLALKVIALSWMVKDLRNSGRFVTK